MTLEQLMGTNSKYSFYEIYECPTEPTKTGKYIGATPIFEQAQGAADRHNYEIVHGARKDQMWFVKGVLTDGTIVTFL